MPNLHYHEGLHRRFPGPRGGLPSPSYPLAPPWGCSRPTPAAEGIGHGALHGVEACRVEYLVIGLGGLLGANARYLVAGWATERFGISFPYGTLIINVSGSFLVGFFLVLTTDRFILHPHWRLFFAIGFLGAFTTFSTFSYESIALLQNRAVLLGLVNMMGSVVLGLIAVMMGMAFARIF